MVARVILSNLITLFAFAASRMNWQSELFSREITFVYVTHAYNYLARKFSHFAGGIGPLDRVKH